jgi:hypothetical protein
MFRATKARLAVATAAAAIAALPAATAEAQTRQEGLVNVSLTDVNVPIGIAANVCDVSANVLAANNFSGPFGDCTAIAPATATGGGNGNTRQQGLVNVSVSDVNVPVGVAANVCNVAANVLASGNFSGPFGDCDAIAPATAG